jgi:hypothetical protein
VRSAVAGAVSARRTSHSATAERLCGAARLPVAADPDPRCRVSRRLHAGGSKPSARRNGDLPMAGMLGLCRCDRACLARRTASASASSMFCLSRASAAWMQGWLISDCSLTPGRLVHRPSGPKNAADGWVIISLRRGALRPDAGRSGAFLHLVDFVGDQAMGLAVHGLGCRGGRRLTSSAATPSSNEWIFM